MATIKKKTLKDGSNSYEIRVSLGRDINGKQILKYKTWIPKPKMTPKQIEKALEREKVLFEEQCRTGKILDTQTKFADFANHWLETNANNFSPSYIKRSEALLTRINQAIGHIPLNKLQPHHLQDFYNKLSEVGVKKTNPNAISHTLAQLLKDKKLSRIAMSNLSGVSAVTVTVACQGKTISLDSANMIADGLGMDLNDIFVVTEKSESLSSKTVNYHHRLISSILETAVKWQVIYDNPARRINPPKVQKKEAVFLDDKEVVQVAKVLMQAPLKWRTILMLLMYSGMRRGEACGLYWKDIDFNNNLIHITKANMYLAGKGIIERETKTESSKRVIKLPNEMMYLLKEYQMSQLCEKQKLGDKWTDTGKVFTQENGLPINPNSISHWTKKFREENDLPEFTPHSLRHTSATLLIMSGVPVRAVAARLGHANQNTTNTIYSHAIQTVDALASDVIGDIIKSQDTQQVSEVSPSQKPHDLTKNN